MINPGWDQLHAWRLQHHYLLDRAASDQLLDVVARIGGVQAQVMAAAEAALHARVDKLPPDQMQTALWHDRTLIKTWVMRGTLHLIRAVDLALFAAAKQAHPAKRPPSYYRYHGVTPAELDAIIEHVPAVLSDTPITREQLADAVSARANKPNLRAVLLSGWGALLKPSAARGDLCFGPNQGQNVTFVQPDQWIGRTDQIDPHDALQTVARRYLAAYGPATADDFARWWGVDAAKGKQVFRALGDLITAVAVDGWLAWALTDTIDQIEAQATADLIRLLPAFDPYTIALLRQPGVLDPLHVKRVSRAQGWIAPVVVRGGRIVGVWERSKERTRSAIQVTLFDPPNAAVERALGEQLEQIGGDPAPSVTIRSD